MIFQPAMFDETRGYNFSALTLQLALLSQAPSAWAPKRRPGTRFVKTPWVFEGNLWIIYGWYLDNMENIWIWNITVFWLEKSTILMVISHSYGYMLRNGCQSIWGRIFSYAHMMPIRPIRPCAAFWFTKCQDWCLHRGIGVRQNYSLNWYL